MTMDPLHVVEVDGVAYAIRRDFYGRYQGYRIKPEGLEQSVGRMQGYVSVKEVWDMLFERTIQPDAHSVGAALDFARFVAENGTMGNTEIGAALAKHAKEVIEKEGLPS